MKRELTAEMEVDFFYVHESIVYGAIRRCGISYLHPNYDDYVQIGLLKLVDAYEEFPKDLFQEAYFYQFTGYAFRKIRWAIIDELRRDQRKQENEGSLPETFDEWQSNSAYEETDFVIWELFHSMLHCLTEKEQMYLTDAVIHQMNVTEIAEKHQVSRKTVYTWKKNVAKKLAHYRTVLTQQ